MKTLDMLKEQYERICSELERTEPGSKEYHELLKDWNEIHERIMVEDKLETDVKFKNEELARPWYRKLDINTVVSAGVTLLAMGMTLNFEKIGNITTKAFNWIPKPRIK